MSLLTIVASAAVELGFSEPNSIMTSSDPAIAVLRVLADKEGKDLARRFDWARLQTEASFTLATATAVQVTAIHTTWSDFGHIINGTMWNRTQGQPVRGPLTPQEWQMKKAAAAQAAWGNYFRIMGDSILFFPNPGGADTIYFEYVSDKWCQSSGGTRQSAWNSDTDTALIDEEIIRLGLIWRFRKAKGFDYGEDFATYEKALADVFGIDSGRPAVDMTGDEYLFGVNIPDGSWNIS